MDEDLLMGGAFTEPDVLTDAAQYYEPELALSEPEDIAMWLGVSERWLPVLNRELWRAEVGLVQAEQDDRDAEDAEMQSRILEMAAGLGVAMNRAPRLQLGPAHAGPGRRREELSLFQEHAVWIMSLAGARIERILDVIEYHDGFADVGRSAFRARVRRHPAQCT